MLARAVQSSVAVRNTKTSPLLALSLGALALAVACGEATGSEATSELSANLPCDVQSIVATKCQQCHDRQLKAGAPMSLASAADWQAQRRGKSVIELAKEQPGFLGIESGFQKGFALAVSYWASLEAIEGWRRNARHMIAKEMGKTKWFRKYVTRIAKVERVY